MSCNLRAAFIPKHSTDSYHAGRAEREEGKREEASEILKRVKASRAEIKDIFRLVELVGSGDRVFSAPDLERDLGQYRGKFARDIGITLEELRILFREACETKHKAENGDMHLWKQGAWPDKGGWEDEWREKVDRYNQEHPIINGYDGEFVPS